MRWPVFLSLLILVAALSCGRAPSPPKPTTSTAKGTNQQVFQVKGAIVSVKPGEKEIVIKHEDVPGYMPAMTMPFDVKDPKELAGLVPGDVVSFRMIVTDTEGWID